MFLIPREGPKGPSELFGKAKTRTFKRGSSLKFRARFQACIGPSWVWVSTLRHLTRAPLGYFYNAPHWGGGLFRAPPPLISETTGPILKIQAAFESPGKTVEGKQILLTSGSRVTSQVRSKSKCSTFRAWSHRRAKLLC